MKKPYIVCHMMTSLDGRIDCTMTSKIKGVDAYYYSLAKLDAPSRLSGKVTGMLEMAEYGEFHANDTTPFGREDFSKKVSAEGYEIIVDTKGTLLWRDDSSYDKPHLIITSEMVPKEYLDYLDSKHISWIACGKKRINLARAMEILAENFGVARLAVVGGGHINAGFLQAGLLDEISLVIGLGIDGREGMASVFDGFSMETEPLAVSLKDIKTYQDGAVWLRYTPEN